MKLWVTGADGLLGSSLRKRAAYATGRKEADIGDLDAVRSFLGKHPDITHIANAAAFSLVDPSETRRDEAHRANALGPENLGRAAAEAGVRLVHLSTDYVFPGNVHRPLKEDDPVKPLSYYGATKLEGERRLLAAFPDACVIRTSWIFGRGGKNFVSKLLELLRTEDEIRLTNDHWNSPTYAADLAEAVVNLRDANGIFHFSNKGAATKYEFGLAMRDMAAKAGFSTKAKRILPVPGSTFPSPAARPVYSAFDLSKAEKSLGKPIRPWGEALADYLDEAYANR